MDAIRNAAAYINAAHDITKEDLTRLSLRHQDVQRATARVNDLVARYVPGWESILTHHYWQEAQDADNHRVVLFRKAKGLLVDLAKSQENGDGFDLDSETEALLIKLGLVARQGDEVHKPLYTTPEGTRLIRAYKAAVEGSPIAQA